MLRWYHAQLRKLNDEKIQLLDDKIQLIRENKEALTQVLNLRRKTTLHVYCARTDHPTPPREDELILYDRDKRRVLTLGLLDAVSLANEIARYVARHGAETVRFHVVERQPGAWLLTEVAPNPEWVTDGRSTRDYTPDEFAALAQCLLCMTRAKAERGRHTSAARHIQRAWRQYRCHLVKIPATMKSDLPRILAYLTRFRRAAVVVDGDELDASFTELLLRLIDRGYHVTAFFRGHVPDAFASDRIFPQVHGPALVTSVVTDRLSDAVFRVSDLERRGPRQSVPTSGAESPEGTCERFKL